MNLLIDVTLIKTKVILTGLLIRTNLVVNTQMYCVTILKIWDPKLANIIYIFTNCMYMLQVYYKNLEIEFVVHVFMSLQS